MLKNWHKVDFVTTQFGEAFMLIISMRMCIFAIDLMRKALRKNIFEFEG